MRVEASQEAVLPLEEIVARDPASSLYLPLVERLTVEGRLDEAIRLCEERRNRPGRGVGDHIVLGRAYLADGRLAEARAELEAALALDRENVVALKALGGILSHAGDHEEAASYYRAVCRVDPSDLESQTALHQITSGEFPEVRPPDVIVGQGGLTWQPIRLPREEEHLPELALGLHTIQEFERAGSGGAPPEGAAGSSRPQPALEEPVLVTDLDLEPLPGAPAAEEPAREPPIERLPPVPVPPPRSGAVVEGNRSAFQTWLRQLTGGEE